MVVARSRTRAPAPKPACPWHVPIVGGPKDFIGAGFPVFSEGNPTKVWPYRSGSELIGYRLAEYRSKKDDRLFHNGTDISYVGTHAWQLRGGELRYLGKFSNNDSAVAQIEKAQSPSVPTPLVVPARTRVRPVSTPVK